MTIAELIRKLEEMPQDAKIELEVIDWLGRSKSTGTNSTFEIFEDVDGKIIIQGIEWDERKCLSKRL